MELGEETKEHIEEYYIEVLLPLSISLLSFASSQREQRGSFVAVTVVNKIYTGIVWRELDSRPDFKKIKHIERRLDVAPLSEEAMRFWEWLSEYYMAPLGDVMRVALPSQIKPSGMSQEQFSDSAYRAKTKSVMMLTAANEDELAEQFDSVKRAKNQYKTLVDIVHMLGDKLFCGSIERVMVEDVVAATALVKRGILSVAVVEQQHGGIVDAVGRLPQLTEAQQGVFDSLQRDFATFDTALLHGVTGSGKTEIYIHFIAQALSRGQSVLYLLPEIAITTQLIERLGRYFGSRVTLYHSKLTDRVRGEIYTRLSKSAGAELVVGVRSAILLPLNRLGLIVVDEEHETSFKQVDPSPRYNARDAAMFLATIYGAKTLLGSATPSLESYANARSGKYAFAQLTERYGDASMPTVVVSDTMRALKRGEKFKHFNKELLDGIKLALEGGRQVMLFQNRRGYAPYIECDSCGWTASCPNCNVTLTYHSGERAMRCHYCGHREAAPVHCPSCKQGVPQPKGFGTEKIELLLAEMLPEARIARLDSDTASSPKRYQRIVADFESHKTDILIGTQMITKGFDFADVSLIGILNADNLLNVADFRASERAYDLMTQVAGRAGRRQGSSQVIIQTSQPQNEILRFVVENDYLGMVNHELAERQSFFYPPYCRIINIVMRHRDRELLWSAADALNTTLRPIFARRVIGPEAPMVERVKGEMIVGFMLKVEREASYVKAKQLLARAISEVERVERFKAVTIYCNVDPL